MSMGAIGISGVSSEIGILRVLRGTNFKITKDELQKGLCSRFGSTEDEAYSAIRLALKVGAIKILSDDEVCLNKVEE